MKRQLLITGASGFLGWNLCRAALPRWNVTGTANAHPVEIPGVSILRCDLTHYPSLQRIFRKVKPDAVIHAAALSDPNRCQTDPRASREINVEVSVNIAGLCADEHVACVFTSTDLVFDGTHPPYREEDPVGPVSTYGEHKCCAEAGMVQRWPSTVICRMPLMFGDPGPAASSFLQPLVKSIAAGSELRLFIDEYRTPVGAGSAAGGLLLALEKGRGTLHLGGRRRISRLEFAQLTARLLQTPAKLVPVNQRSVSMPAARPPDVSLDSTKAYNLGYDPLPLETELKQILKESVREG